MEAVERQDVDSHRRIMPSGIVPEGPVQDVGAPHGRGD